jgi:small-conductance mechanosensitive channel
MFIRRGEIAKAIAIPFSEQTATLMRTTFATSAGEGTAVMPPRTRPCRWPFAVVLAVALALFPLRLLHGSSPAAAQDRDVQWQGQWHTFWRGSHALVRLGQNGDRVIGTYRPGNGRIEGTVKGRRLTGTWTQDGSSGGFTFVLAPDGQSFAGSYDNGEYWNGRRIASDSFRPTPFHRADTPRNALRTIMAAVNAAVAGDSSAALVYEPLLVFDGEPLRAGERHERLLENYQLLDMSTFRIVDVPAQTQEDSLAFDIGPAGSDFSFTVTMRRGEDGRWRLVIPRDETIDDTREALLRATGHDTYAAYRAAREDSPRGALRTFVKGVHDWSTGGRERALSVMDLSGIPSALESINAPLAADYLIQILDRVGYVIWQEIPDDPQRLEPYVHYAHAVGEIEIGRREGEGTPRWRFTEATIAQAPDIFEAIEDLPLAPGLLEPEPFSEYFALRQWVGELSPRLLERGLGLSYWQWIALVLALAAALAGALVAGMAARLAWRFLPDAAAGSARTSAGRARALIRALEVVVAGAILYTAFGAIGLRADLLSFLATGAALLTLVGATAMLFMLAGILGSVFHGHAERKPGAVDVIVSSLATAVVKIVIIVGGAIVAADLVGIPYEGVVAGLGVGGLALAIAARDTVSNFFGAAVLLAERPFKRGDFIQIDGRSAIVEEVGLRSSRLRLFDDALMIIPNARVADGTVINYGRRRKRQILLTVSLPFETPRERLDAFVDGLRQLLRDFPRADAEYYVGLARFAAYAIEVDLWCYVWVSSYGDQVEAQHRLIGDIAALANETGVSFAFPTRTIHVAPASGGVAGEEQPAGAAQAAQ